MKWKRKEKGLKNRRNEASKKIRKEGSEEIDRYGKHESQFVSLWHIQKKEKKRAFQLQKGTQKEEKKEEEEVYVRDLEEGGGSI